MACQPCLEIRDHRPVIIQNNARIYANGYILVHEYLCISRLTLHLTPERVDQTDRPSQISHDQLILKALRNTPSAHPKASFSQGIRKVYARRRPARGQNRHQINPDLIAKPVFERYRFSKC
jgi:Leucine-rich repeat (LRR) protein